MFKMIHRSTLEEVRAELRREIEDGRSERERLRLENQILIAEKQRLQDQLVSNSID